MTLLGGNEADEVHVMVGRAVAVAAFCLGHRPDLVRVEASIERLCIAAEVVPVSADMIILDLGEGELSAMVDGGHGQLA